MTSRLIALAAALIASLVAAPSAFAGGVVGYLTIERTIPERQAVAPFMFEARPRPTLRSLVETIDRAAADPSMRGLVIRLSEASLSAAQAEEIGAAVQRLRAAGKKAHVFTEIYDQTHLMLASYADEVLIQRGGAASLIGVYAEEMFLADMLRWIGITPDFVQIGDYKGAKEMMANSAPSPEWDQNINLLLDGVYANLTARLTAGRGITRERLEEAMRLGPFMAPEDAVRLGLADAVIDRMDLDEHLERHYGAGFEWDAKLSPGEQRRDLSRMGFFEVFSEMMSMMRASRRETRRDTIAVVHIDGPIVDGKSSGGGFMSGPSVGSRTIREVLAQIESDRNVKGVVVRINSPGGSAIASESIWLGLRRVAEKKPVWTSVGSMAASGGYYIAVAGQKIYVNRSSIVGSIGVVGGKLAMQGLYDRLRINVVPRARGPMAGMLGALSAWNDEERAAITRSMQRIYDQFVGRVTQGRPGIDIERTAEGRLFTGERAVELRMADAVGGLDAAVADMASRLGLAPGGFDVMDYPGPRSIEELFEGGFPFGAGEAAARAGALHELRAVVGERAWDEVRDALTALLELRREPVLLASPRVLIFR